MAFKRYWRASTKDRKAIEVDDCVMVFPTEAAASLAAAAPALLEEMEKTLSFWERYIDRVGPSDSWAIARRDAMRKVIALAKGGRV